MCSASELCRLRSSCSPNALSKWLPDSNDAATLPRADAVPCSGLATPEQQPAEGGPSPIQPRDLSRILQPVT